MIELTDRELLFLAESNAIEGITNIDYRAPANALIDRGHVGAYRDSQERARARTPLALDDLCRWQRWLTEEQVRHGHQLPEGGAGVVRSVRYPRDVRVGTHVAPSFADVPALMERYVADLNARSSGLGVAPGDVDVADSLGEFFQRFEAVHPFVDGNGRTGRLIVNYLATLFEYPILIFRAAERPEFYRAHRSKMAMRVFMADKIREAVYWPGRGLLERRSIADFADIYDGLVVERHTLLKKRREWAEADAAR
jgi:Fic family protein